METETTIPLPRLPRSEAAEAGIDFYFNDRKAEHVVEFFERFLNHSKGRFAGRSFILLPWQRKILEDIFGWVRVSDDLRRYRVAYISTAKKSGKSTLLSGIGLYLLTSDSERAAEIYSAAADRDQAGIVAREAANMVKASPLLMRSLELTESRKTISNRATSSFWKVLSGEGFRAEGLNIHGLLFDELHTQRDRRLWDACRYGGAAREQSLVISCTTAGYDRNSICYEQYSYAKAVLRDWRHDPQFYASIHETPADSDWTNPEFWPIANPSWGVTIEPEDFARDQRESLLSSTKENSFRRYRLNQWTSQENRWLNMDLWGLCCNQPPDALEGRECYVGLDLATTYDTSAMVALFPADDGTFDVLCRFWIPGANALERERRDGVPYVMWTNDPTTGMKMTDGDVTDYDVVRKDIEEFSKIYNIRQIAIDRWNATQLSIQLQADGHDVVGFSQGISAMSPPSKMLEHLVATSGIRTGGDGGNKVLNWMAENVSVKPDSNGNYKPVKPKMGSSKRVDGIISLIMALGSYLTNQKPQEVPAEPGMFLL
jgi:phage terminase large subunit-like protein